MDNNAPKSENTFLELAPGNYSFVASDSNGCQSEAILQTIYPVPPGIHFANNNKNKKK